jgi:hypothetical protein
MPRTRPPRATVLAILTLALVGLASGSAAVPTTLLYDGAQGGTPDTQGWAYNVSPNGVATIGQDGESTSVDTTARNRTMAGYLASPAGFAGSTAAVPLLKRTPGYTVAFRARLGQETHAASDDNGDGADDRAGFSVIVLSSDLRGIELAFWEDRIWAQEGGSGDNLFTQAEGVAFDTTTALVDYTLAVEGNTYTLAAGGRTILAGALRDYTAFTGVPNPYEVPSLLFFGDNTSRARARFSIAYIAAGSADITLPTPVFLPFIVRR